MVAHEFSIWRTFLSAMVFVKNHALLYVQGLWLPIALFIALNIPVFFIIPQAIPTPEEAMTTQSISLNVAELYVMFTPLLQGLLLVWMANISSRIVLMGHPGKLWWSMCETRTAIWMVLIALLVSLAAGVLSSILYFILSWLPIDPAMSMTVSIAVYSILAYYLLSRLSLLFPSIAIDHAMRLEDAWKMSKGDGWKLMILFAILPAIIGIVTFLFSLLGLPLITANAVIWWAILLQIASAVLFCANITVIASAYKQLRQRQGKWDVM